MIETNASILVVDPWLEGKAFNSGWSLLDQSTSNKDLLSVLSNSSEKNIFIWYSHEHPDHFAIPLIREFKSSSFKIKFLFQNTLDKRVPIFLQQNGFEVIECGDGREFAIDNDLSIYTWAFRGGDSFCLIVSDDFSVLNLNDCVIAHPKINLAIKKSINKISKKIDLMMTQFGYANWIGNEEDHKLRTAAAQEKLTRIRMQVEILKPELVVPFASFVYFSHKENFYINDKQNNPKKVLSSESSFNFREKIVFMKPNQSFDIQPISATTIDLKKKTQAAESHWMDLFEKIAPKETKNEPLVEMGDLIESFVKYNKVVKFNFLFLPQVLEIIKVLKPLRFYLPDLNIFVECSYIYGLRLKEDSIIFDISCTSMTLKYIFSYENGFDTTRINGRFSVGKNKNSARKFFMFFTPQNLYKNGFGIKHPLYSSQKLVMFLFKFFMRKFNLDWFTKFS